MRETLSQAARRLGVSRAYLHQLRQAGRIPGARLDPVFRVWTVPGSFTLKDRVPRPLGRPKKAKT